MLYRFVSYPQLTVRYKPNISLAWSWGIREKAKRVSLKSMLQLKKSADYSTYQDPHPYVDGSKHVKTL